MKVRTSFPRQVRLIEDGWIPMPDGARLACRIWLPEDAERHPVPAILEYIPYRRRDFTVARDEPMHRYFAGHGYAAVRVDMRGSGDSDGVMTDEYLAQELEDGKAAIAWLAAQPWCTGAVGMMGNSWGGFNALQVAALRPPALKAIITSCSTDDRYADDMHYMGGCVLNDTVDWGTSFFAFLPRPPDPAIVGERWRSQWMERLHELVQPIEPWLEHQRRDAYWKHGSVCEDYAAIQCAVLAVGGWLDGYTNAIPRLLAHLQVPRQGIIGPWAHMFPHMAVPGPAIGFLQIAVQWWERWLKGVENGCEAEPMLRAWIGEAIPARPFYESCPGRWASERQWPSPAIAPASLGLRRGRLVDGPSSRGSLTFRSPQTHGLAAGEWCPYGTGGRGPEFPADQREDDGRSLCFDSALLEAPREILGAPVLEAELSVDQPVAYLVARLCDVAPDGASTRVSFGILNLTHRDGHERLAALVPGQRYKVRLQLNDAGYRFGAGHRIRLAVATTYWPMVWPAPRPATLTLHLEGTRLHLPLRDAAAAEPAPAFPPAEAAPPAPRTQLSPVAWTITGTRDYGTGRLTLSALRDDGLARLEHNGLEIGGAMTERLSIAEDDPLSAETEMTRTILIGRGDWRTRIEARTRLTATETEFVLESTVAAHEGDREIFARRWEKRIPRDLV
jgi:putative CocE/NonD family hydrolase